jgi:hypothetical protein
MAWQVTAYHTDMSDTNLSNKLLTNLKKMNYRGSSQFKKIFFCSRDSQINQVLLYQDVQLHGISSTTNSSSKTEKELLILHAVKYLEKRFLYQSNIEKSTQLFMLLPGQALWKILVSMRY